SLDNAVAAAFQRGMENFGRPWYRPRQLRVFRDTTDLHASGDLRGDIEEALGRSAWLIVMASPQAAASDWVRAEIDWWTTHHGGERMLIAWTDGTLAWDRAAQDFDWSRTDALPRAELERALTAAPGSPRWVDLRWLRDQLDTDGPVPADDPQLVAAVAEFVAPIQGRSKAELIGHHLRLKRRRNRLVAATVVVLCTLLVAATVLGLVAEDRRVAATERQLAAESRQLAAEAASIEGTQPDLARQLLVQAYRLSHTEQAVGAILGSGDIPRVLRTEGTSRAVAFSADGRLTAAAFDGGVTLYDTESGKAVGTTDGPRASMRAVAFSPDGTLLAAADFDGRVHLWSLAGKQLKHLATVATGDDFLSSLAFAGRVPLLVVASSRVTVLDIRDPRRPKVAEVSKDVGAGSDVSRDGRLVAAAGDDGVRVMRLSASGKLTSAGTLKDPSAVVAFAPNDPLLATADEDHTVRLWDIADPERPRLRSVLNGESDNTSVLADRLIAFAPDGKTLATAVGLNEVQLWDVSDPVRPEQGSRLSGHTSLVNCLAFTPDGRTLASTAPDGALARSEEDEGKADGYAKGTVRLWRVLGARASSASDSVPAAPVSPQPFGRDGQFIVAGRQSTLWQVGGVPEPRRLPQPRSAGQGGQLYTFSPDGRTLAAGYPLRLWDASDPSRLRPLTDDRPVDDGMEPVVFRADGALLAMAEPSGQFRLWEVSDPAHPRARSTLKGSKAGPVAFAGDRDLVAALRPDDTSVQLWDLARPDRPVRADVLRTAPARAESLAASADGRTLYVGDSRGTITAWDITEPHRTRQLGAATRHSEAVSHLAAHPDKGLLVSGDRKGDVRLWATGGPAALREAALLASDVELLDGLAYSPGGGTIAVSSGSLSTELWHTDIDAKLRELCADSASITESQWKQYLPERPYDPPCA
ncbi:TIR domain-containing protein, partial [Streptomyces boluensis]